MNNANAKCRVPGGQRSNTWLRWSWPIFGNLALLVAMSLSAQSVNDAEGDAGDPSGYTIDSPASATGPIPNADPPVVTVRATDAKAGEAGRPGALTPHAILTRRRCCPTARCWSRGAMAASGGYLASAELYDPASGTWTATGSLAPHASLTRRRCCPTARCWSQEG